MKEYCVDLDVAKELKKKGFFQESLYIYKKVNFFELYELILNPINRIYFENTYFAPTSDEILKELPRAIECQDNSGDKFITYLQINRDPYILVYDIGYQDIRIEEGDYRFTQCDKKLSNALAKMWIYLKKEGLIK